MPRTARTRSVFAPRGESSSRKAEQPQDPRACRNGGNGGRQPIGKGRHVQPVQPQQARVAQGRRHLPGDLELGRPPKSHARRTIQQQMHVAIGLALEELDVQIVALGAERPVDRVKIVAGRVVAMAGDFRSPAGQFLPRRRQQRAAAGRCALAASDSRSIRFSRSAENSGMKMRSG